LPCRFDGHQRRDSAHSCFACRQLAWRLHCFVKRARARLQLRPARCAAYA
jgi:hypothetical protein